MKYLVELLGGLQIKEVNGGTPPITRFRTRKTGFLLAYLALHPSRRHSREALVNTFWPELPIEAGRDNLSGCLSTLRKILDAPHTPNQSPFMLASRDAIWLDNTAITTDVAAFERTLNAAEERALPPAERRSLLEAAAAFYRGPLLPEIYEDWAIREQARLALRFTAALISLADAQAETGASELALSTLRRAQQADPFDEAAYLSEMRLLLTKGKQDAAHRVYQQFSERLNKELDCQPSSALQRFVRQMSREAESAEQSEPLTASADKSKRESSKAGSVPVAPFHPQPLPIPLTRFWGREAETEQLMRLLALPVQSRLTTLTGPGGVGKTHFAQVIAARLSAQNPMRPIVWVSLATVFDERLFLSMLHQALENTNGSGVGSPNDDSVEGVAARLFSITSASKQGVLLLLDNLEQLIGDDTTLSRVPAQIKILLERVPHLTILATSRRVLGLAGEKEMVLSPLPVPQAIPSLTVLQSRYQTVTAGPLSVLGANPSMALFVDRASLLKPNFTLTTENALIIVALCRRLEGMPLALEMAASWIRTLSVHELSDSLQSQTSGLHSRTRDLPARHRSLRATVEWSWNLLPPAVRDFFLCLSIFRGGCTREAAAFVAQTTSHDTLDNLARLQEHSLLSHHAPEMPAEAGRYFLLEPVREWAREKLYEDVATAETVRKRHAQYFLDTLSTQPALIKADEQNSVAAIETFFQKQASGKAEATDEAAAVTNGLCLAVPLINFWCERGSPRTAYQFAHTAIARYRCAVLEKSANGVPELFAKMLHYAGSAARLLGHLDEAASLLHEAQTRFLQLGSAFRAHAAACEGDKGAVASERGDYISAALHYGHALALGRETGDSKLIAQGAFHLGAAEHELEQWEMRKSTTWRR